MIVLLDHFFCLSVTYCPAKPVYLHPEVIYPSSTHMCVCHLYLAEIMGEFLHFSDQRRESEFIEHELGWETKNRCQNESVVKANSGSQHLKLLNGENETVPINYKQLNLNPVTSTRGKNSLGEVTILKSAFKSLTLRLPARPRAPLHGTTAAARENTWLTAVFFFFGRYKVELKLSNITKGWFQEKHVVSTLSPETGGQQEKQKTDFPHSRGVH